MARFEIKPVTSRRRWKKEEVNKREAREVCHRPTGKALVLNGQKRPVRGVLTPRRTLSFISRLSLFPAYKVNSRRHTLAYPLSLSKSKENPFKDHFRIPLHGQA